MDKSLFAKTKKLITDLFLFEKRETSFKDYIDCIYAQKSIESYVHIFREDRSGRLFFQRGRLVMLEALKPLNLCLGGKSRGSLYITSGEVLLLYTGGLGPKAPEAVDGREGKGGGMEAGWTRPLMGLMCRPDSPSLIQR